MPTVHRTVETKVPADKVFAFLADFENAEKWDSGTKSCTRVSGDGGPGTVYRNVSEFAGREVELDYTTEVVSQPRFVIVGRNKTTESRDTIVVTPTATGSTVDYTAEFTFSGPARFLGPLIRPLLERLGTKTAAQLSDALERL